MIQYRKSYFDIYNSDELIILIEIRNCGDLVTNPVTVYINLIDSIIDFISKYYPVRYIYSHKKLWKYINALVDSFNNDINAFIITLITDEDNQEVGDIRISCRNNLIEANHNHQNNCY